MGVSLPKQLQCPVELIILLSMSDIRPMGTDSKQDKGNLDGQQQTTEDTLASDFQFPSPVPAAWHEDPKCRPPCRYLAPLALRIWQDTKTGQ